MRAGAPPRPKLRTEVLGPKFEEVHREFRPKILRYLTRLVGREEAEDLTQEVFLRVSRSLSRFQGRSQLSTWIYRIATNAAIDKVRTSGRADDKTVGLDETYETETLDAWTDGQPLTTDERVMLKEMFDCYRRFIEQLPAPLKTVVVLKDLEELSNADIAKILRLSLDTVKIRLHRGRERLYAELRAHCPACDWPLHLLRRRT